MTIATEIPAIIPGDIPVPLKRNIIILIFIYYRNLHILLLYTINLLTHSFTIVSNVHR